MITRRALLLAPGVLSAAPAAALEEPHFPSRMHLFVWRNWGLLNLDRMAQVLGTDQSKVAALGRSMGLPQKPRLTRDQLRRIYITVIRQNWHILPEDQLIALLGWDRKRYEFTLKEDDFLDVKLGMPKPHCEQLRYHRPTLQEARLAARIRTIAGRHEDSVPRFDFVARLSEPSPTLSPPVHNSAWDVRFAYSYFALYGDPLLEPETDPFPEGYLQKLAASGINGVWLQGVLNTLAPAKEFPEFGQNWQKRLETLNDLVARAARHGVRVFLYLNEPRAMPEAFFGNRPGLRGSRHQDLFAMCTSAPEVRQWITDSLAHVFQHVPQLGGVFTISMSENHTNCFSHGGAWAVRPPGAGDCPRCTKRSSWDALGELFSAMHEGVRRASKTAEVMHYDWGWPDEMSDRLIPLLAKDCRIISISEWSQPVRRGGIDEQRRPVGQGRHRDCRRRVRVGRYGQVPGGCAEVQRGDVPDASLQGAPERLQRVAD